MLKAVNIKWETDGMDVNLPTEIEIPTEFVDMDKVSDWLSEKTGFLHDGFSIIETDPSSNLTQILLSNAIQYMIDDELSDEEIAEYLGISVTQLKSII